MSEKRKNKFNIRKKVLFILCIVLSFSVIGNFIIGGEIFKKAQVAAFDREAFATARGLQTSINSLIEKSYLPYTEIVNCEPVLDNFVDNSKDVLYVYTTDSQGNALYLSKDAVVDGISREELKKGVLEGAEGRIENEDKQMLYYILPLEEIKQVEGKAVVNRVGVLVVAYPRTCITEPLNRLYTYNAILAVITYVCTLMLAFLLLTRWVTKPLQTLDKAIRNVSKKGLMEPIVLEVNTNDEIGQIGQSFNDMLMQLDATTVSKNYIDSIVVNMSEALFVIDIRMCIERVNDAAIELLGYEKEEIQGKSVNILYANQDENPFLQEGFTKDIENEKVTNSEIEFVTKTGEKKPVSINLSAIKDDDGNVTKYVCTARDITDIKKARDILMYQANYDELTGLFNRYKLEQGIEKILENNNQVHTFVMIDLDKFKVINDVCGHTAGDNFLKHIAYMLKSAVGDNNLVARLGGDEFAIIMYDMGAQKAKPVLERLLKDVKSFNFSWDNKVFNVGMSIGAVEISNSNLDRLSIFNTADKACYIAKQKGGNRIHVYTESDKEIIQQDEESMLSVVTSAFENNGFFLEYQPIVSLDNERKVQGYEVLVRMKTREGEVLKPGAFFSTIERYNKSLALDQWVIHTFCESYHKSIVKMCAEADVQFNINLADASINSENFAEYVCKEFGEYNVPSDKVCFEISESCVISNFLNVKQFVEKIKSTGCKLAIDNFGIGMLSFKYLRLLDVDTVKISGTLINETDKSAVDVAVVRSIEEVAHLLNIKTIAGCVESRGVWEKVKELGIDYAQGYEIMKPGSIEEVIK